MPVFPLEDFCTKIVSNDPKLAPETSFEEHRLEAYEHGYKAGWDDAAAAQSDEQSRIAVDFARNLQDLSFTYHEARGQILSSLEPLLKELVSKVLPNIAYENLANTIIGEVQSIAKIHTQADIQIVISPVNRVSLEKLLDHQGSGLEIAIIDEPSMAEGLAFIRFGDSEKQIDFTTILTQFSQSVDNFFEQQEKVASNG